MQTKQRFRTGWIAYHHTSLTVYVCRHRRCRQSRHRVSYHSFRIGAGRHKDRASDQTLEDEIGDPYRNGQNVITRTPSQTRVPMSFPWGQP
jgi:hypothetical protein